MYDSLYYRYINIHYIRYKGSVYANILTMLLEDRLVAKKKLTKNTLCQIICTLVRNSEFQVCILNHT